MYRVNVSLVIILDHGEKSREKVPQTCSVSHVCEFDPWAKPSKFQFLCHMYFLWQILFLLGLKVRKISWNGSGGITWNSGRWGGNDKYKTKLLDPWLSSHELSCVFYLLTGRKFRSTNYDEQPKLAMMTMELALEQTQCFKNVFILVGLLQTTLMLDSGA